jgi:hypothetical protein
LKDGLEYPQYYDAGLYINLSTKFGEFFSKQIYFPDTYRGYLFPWLIGLITKLLPLSFAVIFINSSLIVLLSYYLLPTIQNSIFNNPQQNNYSGIFYFVLITYFWSGYFQYALSDFPALICLLASIILLLKNKLKYIFWSGIFLASALNIRPIYQINLLVFFIFIILIYKRNYLAYLLMLLGFIIVLLPQSIINYHYNNTYSPFVQTSKTFGHNLYTQQLYWGVEVQKYETYVGEKSLYPSPSVIFKDSHGVKLYHSELENKLQNTTNYIGFILQHPIFYSKLILKHLFNGVDIKYRSPYIVDLSISNWFSLFNYLVLALSFYCLILNNINQNHAKLCKSTLKKIFIYLNLIMPILLVIPIAIEVRFFLPIYLLSYIYVVNGLFKIAKLKVNLLLGFVLICFIVGSGFWLSHITYNELSYVKGIEKL